MMSMFLTMSLMASFSSNWWSIPLWFSDPWCILCTIKLWKGKSFEFLIGFISFSSRNFGDKFSFFRGSCELALIQSFRSSLCLSLCTTCDAPLSCRANAHVLRYILLNIKYLRAMRLQFGYSCSQPLYRIIGQSLTVTFLTRFCERVERPSETYGLEQSDYFFRSKVRPSHLILKDLRLVVDPICVFSGYDLFGMTYPEFRRRSDSPDIRSRDLPTRD